MIELKFGTMTEYLLYMETTSEKLFPNNVVNNVNAESPVAIPEDYRVVSLTSSSGSYSGLNFAVDDGTTWPEMLIEFAELLNNIPNDYNYYIDMDILRKHINSAREEYSQKLLTSKNK